jgi:hypothetical protein
LINRLLTLGCDLVGAGIQFSPDCYRKA